MPDTVPDIAAGADAGTGVATVTTVATGAGRGASCRVAGDAWDLERHHSIRHQVFVEEQRLFHPNDRDVRDDDPATIKVLGVRHGEPVGAVRLYPLDAEGARWQGDRLAVLPSHRRYVAGAPLVRFAVHTAGQLGGQVMVAHVQLANVAFFERLGWRCDGDVETYVGVEHQLMAIPL